MTPHQVLRNKQTLAGAQVGLLGLVKTSEVLLNCPCLHSRWKVVSGTLVGRGSLLCYPQTIPMSSRSRLLDSGHHEHQLTGRTQMTDIQTGWQRSIFI